MTQDLTNGLLASLWYLIIPETT